MTIANFEELCRGLCEVAGCAIPEAAVGQQDAKAISIMLNGIEVTLGHDPTRGPGHAFVLTRFGRLPDGHELEACLALLETNCLMLGENSPSFGYDRLTSDVLLQHICAFESATPQGLYQSIIRFASIARDWRCTHLLAPGPVSAASGDGGSGRRIIDEPGA